MKLLLLTDDYLPHSRKVSAKMMHDLAVEFIRKGHSVTVLTPRADQKMKYSIEELDGVRVCYFKSGPLKNVNLVMRAINETLLSFRAWRSMRRNILAEQFDAIVYYSPTIFWGMLVRHLKRKWMAPAFLILRDIFPQWVVDNGMLGKYSPVTVFFKFFEKVNYSAADTIALQSPNNLQWFNDHLNEKGKYNTSLLYNWTNPAKINSDNSFRKKHGLEDKVLFFYGGNIGKAQDTLSLVRLADSLKEYESAFFVILGEGDEVENVVNEINRRRLSNISYYPSVSQEEYARLVSDIDVGLFTLNASHKTHNFPGKLLGYMAQQKPILGCVNEGNDVIELINENGAGFVSITGDDDVLFRNARALLEDSVLRIDCGKNAKKVLDEYFSVEKAVEVILEGTTGYVR